MRRFSWSRESTVLVVACLYLFGLPNHTIAREQHAPVFDVQVPQESTDEAVSANGSVHDPRSAIDRCEIWVNDGLAYSMKADQTGHSVKITLLLSLRAYNNQVSFVVVYRDRTAVRRDYAVYRTVSPENRWAVIVGVGLYANLPLRRTNATSDATAVVGALLTAGLPRSNISLLTDSDATRTAVFSAISRLRDKAGPNDKILFYFSGLGTSQQDTGQPALLTFDSETGALGRDGVRLIDIIGQLKAVNAASISLVLDTSFSFLGTETPSRSLNSGLLSVSRQDSSLTWTSRLALPSNIVIYLASRSDEVAYDSALLSRGEFTHAFLETIHNLSETKAPSNGCLEWTSLEAGVDQEFSKNGFKAQHPIALLGSGQRSFCFVKPSSSKVIAVKTVSPVRADGSLDIDIDLAPGAAVASYTITVNGIVLETVSAARRHATVILSPGNNHVTVSALDSTTVGSTSFEAAAPNDPRTTYYLPDEHPSVHVNRGEPGHVQRTTDQTYHLYALIGDKTSKKLTYEIRNNGTVLIHRAITRVHRDDYLEVSYPVFLQDGTNRIAVEVRDQTGRKFNQVIQQITRRMPEKIRAVVVGVNRYAYESSPSPPYLSGAENDARLISQTLLRHTDAHPSDIDLLLGEDATYDAVKKVLAGASALRGTETESAQNDRKVVFYFAGYGATIGPNGQTTRCLVLFDSDPVSGRNCLSTEELSRLLDGGQWKGQMIIIDASYDGVGSSSRLSDLGSRTARDLFSSSADWRQTAEWGRDRLALVGCRTNTPCWESRDLGHGLFTYGLARSLESGDEQTSSSVYDVYTYASRYVTEHTNGQQSPLLKGDSAGKFFFKTNPSELLEQAYLYIRRMRADQLGMKAIDPDDVRRAEGVIVKLGAWHPESGLPNALLGAVAAIQKQYSRAASLLDNATLGTKRAIAGNPRGEATLQQRQELHDELVLRSWYLVGTGQLRAAKESCAEAKQLSATSLPALYCLAGLAAADGDYKLLNSLCKEALQIISTNASEGSRVAAASPELISHEELGRFELWEVLSLLRDHHFVRSAARFLEYRKRVIPEEALASTESTWTRAVTEYLWYRHERTLETFLSEQGDRKLAEFLCQRDAYKGLKALSWGDRQEAATRFRSVVSQGKPEFFEHWIAVNELRQLRLTGDRGRK